MNPVQKTDLKTYRREYYRRLYHTNPEYKEHKKSYNKALYEHKTIRCVECFKRQKYDDLKLMNYKYNEEHFLCPNCLPENKVEQIKTGRGRPRKMKLEDDIFVIELIV